MALRARNVFRAFEKRASGVFKAHVWMPKTFSKSFAVVVGLLESSLYASTTRFSSSSFELHSHLSPSDLSTFEVFKVFNHWGKVFELNMNTLRSWSIPQKAPTKSVADISVYYESGVPEYFNIYVRRAPIPNMHLAFFAVLQGVIIFWLLLFLFKQLGLATNIAPY